MPLFVPIEREQEERKGEFEPNSNIASFITLNFERRMILTKLREMDPETFHESTLIFERKIGDDY